MTAYYNEIDPYAAQWLRNLIAAGHIAPGDVDERSIVDVRADELRGYTQCHFFAGIGVWSYALRRAGWRDDRPVWTGSCPCQPFSVAGKGLGHEDERDLWPTWQGLIAERNPVDVFGEQVADGDGYAWLDDVGHGLESLGYTVGAICSAACGFGAPNERQRLNFVAHARHESTRRAATPGQAQGWRPFGDAAGRGGAGGMGNPEQPGLERHSRHEPDWHQPGRLRADKTRPAGPTGATGGFWANAQWIHCRPERDYPGGRWRPAEPGTFPLAAGIANRVGRLRAYGNAVNAEATTEFIRAAIEVMP